QKWAELAPDDGMPYRFIAVIYQGLSASDLAAENYAKALARQLPPDVREASLVELAQVQIERTRYDDGLACLERLPVHALVEPKVQECRAECLVGIGRHAEATA